MHQVFEEIGEQSQHNAVCKSGPIHLAEQPMDPEGAKGLPSIPVELSLSKRLIFSGFIRCLTGVLGRYAACR
jgi:hypothetical protein